MILIPGIDLLGGKVVQLRQGQREAATECADDPLEVVRKLRKAGACFFHITDLDAVFETGDNRETLCKFADDMIGIQVGGGIRDAETVEKLLAGGADRVVVGTLFFEEPDVAKELVDRFGLRVMAALDVEDGEVRVRGWAEQSGHGLEQAIELLAGSGVQHVVYREIDRGNLSPCPDVDTLRRLVGKDEHAVYAHVGIKKLDELGGLEALTEEGLTGVILGHAEGTLDVSEALAQA